MLKQKMQDAETSGSAARFVREAEYDGCIELSNETARLVLEPNLGGRILSYGLNGVEALYRNPSQNGLVWNGHSNIPHPCGGRCDIGPEFGGLRRDELWMGRWTAEITGPRSARLTSLTLKECGVQLVRDFALAEASSHVRFSQVIRNHGEKPVRAFHWSRTFVGGGGIVLAPLPQQGKFPFGYALGGPPGVVDFQPREERVRIREGILEIVGPPSRAKVVLDVEPGWLAYVSPAGLLFLKKFPVYADRPYGELAANNASIWYSGKANAPAWSGSEHPVEIEPIGPLETLLPGEECSFTEHWWLNPFSFPDDRRVNLERLLATIAAAEPDEPQGASVPFTP